MSISPSRPAKAALVATFAFAYVPAILAGAAPARAQSLANLTPLRGVTLQGTDVKDDFILDPGTLGPCQQTLDDPLIQAWNCDVSDAKLRLSNALSAPRALILHKDHVWIRHVFPGRSVRVVYFDYDGDYPMTAGDGTAFTTLAHLQIEERYTPASLDGPENTIIRGYISLPDDGTSVALRAWSTAP
jgi:hypothetical protein